MLCFYKLILVKQFISLLSFAGYTVVDYVMSFGLSAKRKKQTTSKEVTIDVLISPTIQRARARCILCRQPYLLTYLLMELSPSGGAANSAATQEFPSILWNPKVF
jgi:hypothetical protein